MSNAGELKGDHLVNGITYKDEPLTEVNGKGLEFDFSGFLITGGIAINIF